MNDAQRAWCLETAKVVAARLSFLDAGPRILVLSHFALESGYGTARAAKMGHNLANLTAGAAWKGEKWSDVGGDVNASGKRITQVWRSYPSVEAFVSDYWRFLGPAANCGRYVMARDYIEAGLLEPASRALHAAGYYELNPTEYSARWQAVKTAIEALKE